MKLLGSSEVTRRTIYDLPKRAILGDSYEAITQKGFSNWLKDSVLAWQERRTRLPEEAKEE